MGASEARDGSKFTVSKRKQLILRQSTINNFSLEEV